MQTVAVLAGGSSEEREVSLRSGQAVAAALEAAGYSVEMIDPISSSDVEAIGSKNVAFPVLHGRGGEDGSIQARLDSLGVAYVGSDAAASALCFDKWRYKQLLSSQAIMQAEGELVDEAGFWQSGLSKKSFILKPNDGGSSIDNLIYRQGEVNASHIQALFAKYPRMLLEALIEGVEITVAVLGHESLSVIEIIPPADGEFDYENKYNGQTQELCPPQHLSQTIQTAAQTLAAKIHRLAGCRDFSRTDMMAGNDGKLYVLETNTIPGMTDQSLFPKAAQAAGIDMPRLVDRLVRMALER